jgi:hypothetical protein
MFAKKPKQLKDEKFDGCGLDPHTGDCVKKFNLQRRREELGPKVQYLYRQLEKTTNQQQRVQLLHEFGEELGRRSIGNGGRVKTKGGGNVPQGQRVPTSSVPTEAVISGTAKGDKGAGNQIAKPRTSREYYELS